MVVGPDPRVRSGEFAREENQLRGPTAYKWGIDLDTGRNERSVRSRHTREYPRRKIALGFLERKFAQTLATGSVMASDSARISTRGQHVLRIEGIFHAAHQFKIRARRTPHNIRGGFYFCGAPLQHR